MPDKIVGIIPARLESTRLKNKLLLDLCGSTVIERVYQNAISFGIFDQIVIATDSLEIKDKASQFSAPVIMTSSQHKSGTSRIAEAIQSIEADIIVNIQGDEPFIQKSQIEKMISPFGQNSDSLISTLCYKNESIEESKDPNKVKVVFDQNNNALYFSRSLIPFLRNQKDLSHWYLHIGSYSYRRSFLEQFHELGSCPLEHFEKLEQLNFLYHGYKIKVIEVTEQTIGIDTEKDLLKARLHFKNLK